MFLVSQMLILSTVSFGFVIFVLKQAIFGQNGHSVSISIKMGLIFMLSNLKLKCPGLNCENTHGKVKYTSMFKIVLSYGKKDFPNSHPCIVIVAAKLSFWPLV